MSLSSDVKNPSILLLPSTILKYFREELERFADKEEKKESIYGCGFKIGNDIAGSMAPENVNLEKLLSLLWAEVGLGIMILEKESEEEIIFEDRQSIEVELTGSSDEPVCFFTSGALAGLLSGLFGKDYLCEELECRAVNNSVCRFRLKMKIGKNI